LRPDGLVLSDSSTVEGTHLGIPFVSLANTHGGRAIYANAVAAGALCASVGLPFVALKRALTETFAAKGDAIAQSNVDAARAGFDFTVEGLGNRRSEELPERGERYAFASAHEAIPIAAAGAGCRFISAYPMSPSTGIVTAFSRHADLGAFAEQAEDEIAAINMAIGASAAGARAMTATSGGGFALMAESLSLAGMIETPIVILVAQRPGPATGLPTRTAQEDLLFAVHAGHGEFPRVVLAPSDPQEAIDLTVRAFDLADRFQVPVLLLTDQFLADAHFSLDRLSVPDEIPGPYLADPKVVETYRRYEPTETGVSPRLYFGQSEHLVCLDSDEHTAEGHITEDLRTVRPAAVAKRLEKGRRIKRAIAPPRVDRIDDAESILVGWGSTRGAIEEAAVVLRENGHKIGTIHFTEVWPLPAASFPSDTAYVAVEGNATGQFARLLEAEYGISFERTIARSDGLPLNAEAILEATS
jgi:2-oxoglutarate ferredoxin oxidoreductase subunit alpha